MCLSGGVGYQPAIASLAIAAVLRRALTRCKQSAERRAGSGIVDDSAAGA